MLCKSLEDVSQGGKVWINICEIAGKNFILDRNRIAAPASLVSLPFWTDIMNEIYIYKGRNGVAPSSYSGDSFLAWSSVFSEPGAHIRQP